MVKNPLANAEVMRDSGLSPRSGRSPGGGYGNPFQYSCLEKPMDEEPSMGGGTPMGRRNAHGRRNRPWAEEPSMGRRNAHRGCKVSDRTEAT